MIASIIAFMLWNVVIFLGLCIVSGWCRFLPDSPTHRVLAEAIFTLCASTLIVFF